MRRNSTINVMSPYSFEEDEEDVQIEKDSNANLQTSGETTGRPKGLALATQTEIEAQKKLDQITNKVFYSKLRLTIERLPWFWDSHSHRQEAFGQDSLATVVYLYHCLYNYFVMMTLSLEGARSV